MPFKEVSDGVVDAVSVSRLINDAHINLAASRIELIPIMKVQSYSLQQIFDKNLLFLLPFYIFNLEKNFPQYEYNEATLQSLKNIYSLHAQA